ncbi:MAG: phosphoribosylformylglycinamidine cyclo-ligase [Candidatus Bathyarchaeota archaeon]|nr:phosphoribosylformylglycinamidine cyclo-ligase [Candidatus Termiticorpusculum sp.]MCL1971248.1 phosphoribosylformylglycinamidine cyclo-ligase [Candidatus Termiticorpusculum sp.]
MSKSYTYDDAGVNRKQRVESKKQLCILQETYAQSLFGSVLKLPYGNIFQTGQSQYLDLVIEGVGTKVLIAQLLQKYDTIGVDAVAMAVNDVIRSGAKPLAIADNIHAQESNPALVRDWLSGVAKGAIESGCPVTGGEIGDVAEIIKGISQNAGFDMVIASVGMIDKEDIITGENIVSGDPIIGLASSGLHSNGITLARKILFKQWGGKFEPTDIPNGLNREIGLEALEPTKIYVKPLLKLASKVKIKAAVHITGDAYTKFNNLTRASPGIGFKFDHFHPQPVFALLQKTAAELGYCISDEEMFKTFNMGWGFGIIVDKADLDSAMNVLCQTGVETDVIGEITDKQTVEVVYNGKRMFLS